MLNRLIEAVRGTPSPSVPEVSAAEAARARAAGRAQLVDVREPEEWAAGHIPGAVLIPLAELAARRGELDPARPVVTVCRSGQRSLTAAETLLAAGFRDVRNLTGGMMAWAEAGQPVER